MPETRWLRGTFAGLDRVLREQTKESLARMATLLGVPVVHAAHAGRLECGMPLAPGFRYRSYFAGETQIVTADGRIVSRLAYEDGAGVAVGDIEPGSVPAEPTLPEGFWLERPPRVFSAMWHILEQHGRRYYRRVTKPAGPGAAHGTARASRPLHDPSPTPPHRRR
jgi:hypothetical protein